VDVGLNDDAVVEGDRCVTDDVVVHGVGWLKGLTIREVGKLACIYKEAVAFHFYLYPIHIRAVGVKVYKFDFVASCLASIRLSAYVKNWKLLIEVVHGVYFLVVDCMQIYIHIYIQTKLFLIFFFCVFSAQTHFWTKLVQRPRFPSLDFPRLPQPCEQNDAGEQSQNRPNKQYRPPAFALLRLNDDSALYDCRVTHY